LGSAAQVRFTPVAFHWDFGDGGRLTSGTGGATWADLGVPEFSDTDTSHIYDVRGDVVAGVTVEYRAQYRVGGGSWTAVAGTVAAAAPPLQVAVRHIKTVLVAHDCLQNPAGIGCS